MLTSSFATTSAYLLHLFSIHKPEQEVLFINTGYHFKETLIYRDYLSKIYNLNVREIKAEKYKHNLLPQIKLGLKTQIIVVQSIK